MMILKHVLLVPNTFAREEITEKEKLAQDLKLRAANLVQHVQTMSVVNIVVLRVNSDLVKPVKEHLQVIPKRVPPVLVELYTPVLLGII